MSKSKHGLFLDPRAWAIDFKASDFWKPEKYGMNIDLHPNAFNIPKTGVNKKYQFALVTEVWEKPMRKTLEYLRNKGLKIFLTAREPIKYGELIDAMFNYEKFNINGEYYFKPDAVFAAGSVYADLWRDKTNTHITGYPRWDWYVLNKPKKQKVAQTYKLNPNKKWIFFPDYPPYHYKKIDGKDQMIDLFDAREKTIKTMKSFAEQHKDYQVVIKIHPASMKPYLKGTGKGNEVKGLLKTHLKSPNDTIAVIGDIRNKGNIAKELLACSDLVVGYNSTMLLEASLLNKPVIQAIIGSCSKAQNPYLDAFTTASSENELMSALKKYNQGFDFVSDKAKQMVYNFIYEVDGKACERICSAIKKEL